MKEKVGVIGAGNFGLTLSKLLSINNDVVLFSRKKQIVDAINEKKSYLNFNLPPNIEATTSQEYIASTCNVILPVVQSSAFRESIRSFAPFLHPYHILIHGTKGFDIRNHTDEQIYDGEIDVSEVYTMSDVILQETSVMRVGCLSGPNLAKEILDGEPTATVVGSSYKEVIQVGKKILKNNQFFVFGTLDMLGAELSGALKNTIAIAAGMLDARGFGRNLFGMLITRGLAEMVQIGKAMGSSRYAFLGASGLGDLVATSSSTDSRNYTFGQKIAHGGDFRKTLSEMPEVAEGVKTIKVARALSKKYKLVTPINNMLERVVFEGFDFEEAIQNLMRYPFDMERSLENLMEA